MAYGNEIVDPTGLGRWSGTTICGKDNKQLSVITAYRVCPGSTIHTLGAPSAGNSRSIEPKEQNHPNHERYFSTTSDC